MNAIFALLFLATSALFLFVNPNEFLPAMLKGGEKAVTLTLSLLAVYCVWLGFFKVMEDSGLSRKLSQATYPLCKRLFRSQDKDALFLASCNLATNFLGLPGAPTPMGVKATEKFCEAKNFYARDMLFVLNATSLQLLPTTVIALRGMAGAQNPADIFLPTLLATAFSTLWGGFLVWLFSKRKK